MGRFLSITPATRGKANKESNVQKGWILAFYLPRESPNDDNTSNPKAMLVIHASSFLKPAEWDWCEAGRGRTSGGLKRRCIILWRCADAYNKSERALAALLLKCTNVIRSFLSLAFFNPPKAILVPGMYFFGFSRYSN